MPLSDSRWRRFTNREIDESARKSGDFVDGADVRRRIGLSSKVNFDSTAFDKVTAARIGSYSGFKKDWPGLGVLADKLKSDSPSTANKNVRDKIAGALIEHGYSLAAYGDKNLAEQGKIYINGTGDYYFKDPNGALVEGHLNFTNNELDDLNNKLNDVDLKNKVIDALKEDGKTLIPYQETKLKFKLLSEHFKELAKMVPKTFMAGSLRTFMTTEIEEARKVLVEQQKQELSNLNKLFVDVDFKNDFMDSTGTPPGKLEEARRAMLDELNASHKQQLKEFSESSKESLAQLAKAETNQMRELGLIKNTTIDNKKQKANVDAVQRQWYKDHGGNTYMPEIDLSGNSDDDYTLRGISLNDFKVLYTNSGKEITHEENGSWKIKYGLWDRIKLYNNPIHANLKADMLLMVQAVKAGNPDDAITLNINGFKGNNGKDAEEKARDLYRACIQAGYPPEKINININGEPRNAYNKKAEKDKPAQFDPQGLFSNDVYKQEYATLVSTSKEIIKEQAKFKSENVSLESDQLAIRTELNKLRQESYKAAAKKEADHTQALGLGHS